MKKIFTFFTLIAISLVVCAQQFVPNYDESKMPPYTLPDPLVFENGDKVQDESEWNRRRSEILRLFETEVYGKSPEWNGRIVANEIAVNEHAFSDEAIMKEVKLTLQDNGREHSMKMLLYLPKIGSKSPVFLGYNFEGNHTVTDDPAITPADKWLEDGSVPTKGDGNGRGSLSRRWPVKEIIERGYGIATIYYYDVDPDFDDGFKNGVHALYSQSRDSDSWGSVAAWAWGLSRALDYLQTLDNVDAKKVIVFGHSRLGKAAVWAGATDLRFAMVISNNSGCGGAALSKRIYGETVGRINRAFPHWFCDNYNKYNENEALLPVDQHELLALIAPRPLYVASADEDQWADPKGEFLSCKAAEPVYKLLGKEGLPVDEMPLVSTPVRGTIGYHLRKGVHDILLYDWMQYLEFADKHLR